MNVTDDKGSECVDGIKRRNFVIRNGTPVFGQFVIDLIYIEVVMLTVIAEIGG